MGFWDEVVRVTGAAAGETGSVPAPVAPAMSASLVREAVAMLAEGGAGGVAGLAQRFERQGLGQVIASWLGPGENLPISGPQLRAVLGEPRLAQVAQRLELPPAAAAATLAAVLPAVVDRLSPQGTLEPQLLRQGLDWMQAGPAAGAPA
jgi:uncharacterized protein YidB (DUF937 family)